MTAAWKEEAFEASDPEDHVGLRLRTKPGDVSPETWMDFEIHRWNGDTLERFAHGNVSWDVCMNVHTDGALHFCDPEDVDRFARALRRIYEIAAETIPHWDGPRTVGKAVRADAQ